MKKLFIGFAVFAGHLVLTVLFIFWVCNLFGFVADAAAVFITSFTVATLAVITTAFYFQVTGINQ